MEAFTHRTDRVVFSFAPVDFNEYFATHHNPGALLAEIFGDFKRNPLDRLTHYINTLLGAYTSEDEFAEEFGQGSASLMGMMVTAASEGDLSTVLELWFFWNLVKGQTLSWVQYKIPEELDLESGSWIDCTLELVPEKLDEPLESLSL